MWGEQKKLNLLESSKEVPKLGTLEAAAMSDAMARTQVMCAASSVPLMASWGVGGHNDCRKRVVCCGVVEGAVAEVLEGSD